MVDMKRALLSVTWIVLVVFATGCSRKVKIVEFVDYQCPSCKRAAVHIKKLKKEFGRKLVVEVKNLPVKHLHPYAVIAAKAAECARKQHKFWPMYFKLFEKSPVLSREDILSYAVELDLNIDRFIPCLDSRETSRIVQEHLTEARKLKLTGTPSFVIEGEVLTGVPSYETLRTIVKRLISGHRFKHSTVKITVVNDEKCPTCGTTRYVAELKKIFFNNEVRTLSVYSPEGKKLKKDYGIQWLPGIVITGEPEEYANFYVMYPLRLVKVKGAYVVNPAFYQIGYSDEIPSQDPLMTYGSPGKALVRMVPYTSFGPGCRGCAEAAKYIQSIVEQFQGRVSVTYKFLVINNDDPAYEAALAVLCAAEQGGMARMMKIIYTRGFTRDYRAFAQAAGVKNLRKFTECISERRYKNKIAEAVREAVRLWVPFAPYTFIDHYRFPDIPNPKWLKGLLSDLVALAARR